METTKKYSTLPRIHCWDDLNDYFSDPSLSNLSKSRSASNLSSEQQNEALVQNPIFSSLNSSDQNIYDIPNRVSVKKLSREREKQHIYQNPQTTGPNTKLYVNKDGYKKRDTTQQSADSTPSSQLRKTTALTAVPNRYDKQKRTEAALHSRLSRSMPDLAQDEDSLVISNVKGLFQNLRPSQNATQFAKKPALPMKYDHLKSQDEGNPRSSSSSTSLSLNVRTEAIEEGLLPYSTSVPLYVSPVINSSGSKVKSMLSKFETQNLPGKLLFNEQPKTEIVAIPSSSSSTASLQVDENVYDIPVTISCSLDDTCLPASVYDQPSAQVKSRPSSDAKLKKIFGVNSLDDDILAEANNIKLQKKKKSRHSKTKKSKSDVGSEKSLYAISTLPNSNNQKPLKMTTRVENSSSSADSGMGHSERPDSGSPRNSKRKSSDKRSFRDSDFIDQPETEEVDIPGPRVSDSDFESDEECPKTRAPQPEKFIDNSHKVAYEFLTSERTYVDRLYLLSEIFQSKITVNNEKHKWFSGDIIKDIFSNITSIYDFHKKFFLPALETRLLIWTTKPCIGDILKDISPFLKIYAVYVSNFDKAMSQLTTYRTKFPKFANALANIVQSEKACNGLALEHHMLEPVQRIPRYELLLKEYLKKLSTGSADKEDALKALGVISKAAEHSNNRIKITEEIGNLFKLNAHIDGMDIIDPSRRLLKEGKIDMLSPKNQELQERYIFLFNDTLLSCVHRKTKLTGSKTTYKVKDKLDIDGMQILDSNDQRFQIVTAGRELEFQAASEEDKEDWLKVLWAAVRELIRKKDTFRNNITESFNIDYDKQLGKKEPVFIKDEDVTMCMRCGTDFDKLLKRRHHCRACGYVVCGKCSCNQVEIAYNDNKLDRVCDKCSHIISKTDVSENTARRSFVPYLEDINHFMTELHLLQKTVWNKYWVVVTYHDLFALRAPKDVRAVLTLPVKLYQVKDITMEDTIHREFVFKLEHGNTAYIFAADSEKLKTKWMNVLSEGIAKDVGEHNLTL